MDDDVIRDLLARVARAYMGLPAGYLAAPFGHVQAHGGDLEAVRRWVEANNGWVDNPPAPKRAGLRADVVVERTAPGRIRFVIPASALASP